VIVQELSNPLGLHRSNLAPGRPVTDLVNRYRAIHLSYSIHDKKYFEYFRCRLIQEPTESSDMTTVGSKIAPIAIDTDSRSSRYVVIQFLTS